MPAMDLRSQPNALQDEESPGGVMRSDTGQSPARRTAIATNASSSL
jgi:hypothetical protein